MDPYGPPREGPFFFALSVTIAFVKLPGLPSERIVQLVEPVLRAHRVEGVELVWRSDRLGWLLELTLEHPEAKLPGQGITVDLCSEISRDLSAALDVSDLIGPRYRLEVGSPGVERALYRLDDYRRFRGQAAKIKLKRPYRMMDDATDENPEGSTEQASVENSPVEKTPWTGQRVLRGTLGDVDPENRVTLETDVGIVSLELDSIESARLMFEWQAKPRGSRPGRSTASGHKARGVKRSK